MSKYLILDRVSLHLGGQEILRDVSLELAEGQVLALLGPSGSGKSSVLRVLLGLEVPSSGEIHLDGSLLSRAGQIVVPPQERKMAVVFQGLALWPHLTVAGNLRFVLRSMAKREGTKISAQEELKRIAEMLEQVGLSGFSERFPSSLSGGEQQRVAIARALVLDPKVVVLDEPLANLDIAMKQELLSLFSELFVNRKASVLYVSHDPQEALSLASQLCILEGGQRSYCGGFKGIPSEQSAFMQAVVQSLQGQV